MKKIKLLSLSAILLTATLIGTNKGNIATGTYAKAAEPRLVALSYSETVSTLKNITGYTYSTRYQLTSKYRDLTFTSDGIYEYATCPRFEYNVHLSEEKFTGYVFKSDSNIASTSVSFSSFTSDSLCVSSSVGVYAGTSFAGASAEISASIGASESISHTLSVSLDRQINDYSNNGGHYGLYVDLYTCDKIYLKFRGNSLVGGYHGINNPSVTTGYVFKTRNV